MLIVNSLFIQDKLRFPSYFFVTRFIDSNPNPCDFLSSLEVRIVLLCIKISLLTGFFIVRNIKPPVHSQLIWIALLSYDLIFSHASIALSKALPKITHKSVGLILFEIAPLKNN